MKRWHWIAVGIAGVCAALLLAYAAHRYGSRYCLALKAANLAKEAKDRTAPIDCTEFWLNRYQGLLAGLMAAGVALIVARPVFRQLLEMNRQSAVAIRGVEEAFARELEAENAQLASFRDIQSRLSNAVENFDDAVYHAHQHGVDYSNNFADLLRECRSYLRDVSALFARYPDSSPLSTARKDFLRAANAYQHACDKVLTGFRNATVGIDPEYGEEEMDAKQIDAARDVAESARKQVLKDYGVLIGRLRSEIGSQWARVRELQRMARHKV